MIKDERGFTLFELLVAMGIGLILIPVLGTAVYQLYTTTAIGNGSLNVTSDVQLASLYINQDVSSARSGVGSTKGNVSISPDAHSLAITWYDASSNLYQVSYSVSGGQLQRGYSGPGGPSTTAISRNIASASDVSFSQPSSNLIYVTVTSTSNGMTKTANFYVSLRS